ncbi:MAG TPA: DciA family protein [Stellaceae bacterium]|jgi:hypothetical protein|nr:DciA family protein [Stellaceae bacterium]
MSKANLPGGGGAGERRPGFRAAGASLQRIVGPVVGRHGGGILVRLKTEWTAIVGPELAGATWPDALSRDGTLRLRVASAQALAVQHRTPLVIERVNLFFGREVVTRLTLMQGPLPLPPPPPTPATRPLGRDEAAALDRQLAPVASPELRESLARLGRRVIGAS